MKKEKIIEYLYENNVRGDLTIEQMADDLADTPQTDLSAEEFVEGMKNLKMEVKRTDCDRYVVDEAGEKHYGCMGCQTDCPWK